MVKTNFTLDFMGIIHVPIKLYNAVDKKGITLSGMSDCCNSYVGHKSYCKECNEIIEKTHICKAFSDGKVLTKVPQEQIDAIKLKTTGNLVVEGFRTPEYFKNYLQTGKHYFLGVGEERDKQTKIPIPNPEARKTIATMKEALIKSDLIGVGKIIMTNKEEIIALKSFKGGILATVMYYPEQIRASDSIYDTIKNVELDPEDIESAVELIKSMNKVEMESFIDEHEKAMVDIINGKAPTIIEEKKEEVKGSLKEKLKLATKIASEKKE